MKSFSTFLSWLLILLFTSCGNNATQKSAGQSLYESNCTSCHGTDGKLCALGAKDLSVTTFSKEQMMEIITTGKSTMTPFGNMLNKEEVSAVADYVQTLKAK